MESFEYTHRGLNMTLEIKFDGELHITYLEKSLYFVKSFSGEAPKSAGNYESIDLKTIIDQLRDLSQNKSNPFVEIDFADIEYSNMYTRKYVPLTITVKDPLGKVDLTKKYTLNVYEEISSNFNRINHRIDYSNHLFKEQAKLIHDQGERIVELEKIVSEMKVALEKK